MLHLLLLLLHLKFISVHVTSVPAELSRHRQVRLILDETVAVRISFSQTRTYHISIELNFVLLSASTLASSEQPLRGCASFMQKGDDFAETADSPPA
jgi:hypothetical protein